MATFEFTARDEFAQYLSRLEDGADEIAKRAIYDGAGIVADEIKSAIDSIPEDTARFLLSGEKYQSATKDEKEDLRRSFGVSPMKGNSFDGWNVKLGFDGYGSNPTKQYPKGVPNPLIARSIESGSTVRVKYPFVRRSVNKMKKKAIEAMDKKILEQVKEIE